MPLMPLPPASIVTMTRILRKTAGDFPVWRKKMLAVYRRVEFDIVSTFSIGAAEVC